MTVPPLPDVPCVRIHCQWSEGGALQAGSRFYLSYSGSAPSGANCATLAADVGTAWSAHLAAIISNNWTLDEVDVIDIASHSGASGQATPSVVGTRSGTGLPNQVANNVEFDISRRYRGGKPRIFLPGACEADLATQATWSSAFIGDSNAACVAFFAALEALSIGSMGTLAHVNLSYYLGFHNVTNTSGRVRSAPLYRATAIHDTVVGYATKATLGSQRRRRTSVS